MFDGQVVVSCRTEVNSRAVSSARLAQRSGLHCIGTKVRCPAGDVGVIVASCCGKNVFLVVLLVQRHLKGVERRENGLFASQPARSK